jgi:hypothetical protein
MATARPEQHLAASDRRAKVSTPPLSIEPHVRRIAVMQQRSNLQYLKHRKGDHPNLTF